MSPFKIRLLAILVTAAVPVLAADIIRIHVVDGRNGKTIMNEQLQVWLNRNAGRALNLMPGIGGVTDLDAPTGSFIKIASNFYKDCRPFGDGVADRTYSTDEIKNFGIVTQNTCGKLASEPRRGELTFFVRPLHWWEGIKR